MIDKTTKNTYIGIIFLIAAGLFGTSLGPMFPAAMQWVQIMTIKDALANGKSEEEAGTSGSTATFLVLSSAAGEMMISVLVGILFSTCATSSFVFTTFVGSVMVTLLFAAIRFLNSRR